MVVQLSRPQSFAGLYLLQKLDMKDFQFHLYNSLLAEIKRLHKLKEETTRT